MLTAEEQNKITAFLKGKHIPSGLGNEHEACSIAAINLALTGKLTDEIPDCMSPVIGKWIIVVQDAMPDEMRNSREWRELLPLAAGTGRAPEKERERADMVMDWMWGVVLPEVQPVADKCGFGAEWKNMCKERTAQAAEAAWAAARAAAQAAEAAWAAAEAAQAAEAARAAEAAARAASWKTFDPVGLLRKLCA